MSDFILAIFMFSAPLFIWTTSINNLNKTSFKEVN